MLTTFAQARYWAAMRVALLCSVAMGALAAFAALPRGLGFLVSQFGLSWQDALAIISILLTEGSAGIAVFAPWLIPFVGTLDGLILFVGVSAAAGW